jgi:hypothetical protein
MFHIVFRPFKPVFVFGIAVVLAGCVAPTMPGSVPPPTSPAAGGQGLTSDPFAYCAAVGTIDSPDGRYSGPRLPDSILQGMLRQGIVTADMPLEARQHTVWRCMNASVWVCNFGANIPCLEKADTSQAATPAMQDFCKTNPAAVGIPAAVTGRATVYFWDCKDGKPEVVRPLTTVDPQGYLAIFWHELSSK